MSVNNEYKFHKLLANTNWIDVIGNNTDTNDQVIKLTMKIDEYYDKCFPLKIKFVGLNTINNPWITKAILISINEKNRQGFLARLEKYDIRIYNIYRNYGNNSDTNCKKTIL